MSTHIRRIAVLFPSAHPSYRTMASAMERGFRHWGVEAVARLGLNDEAGVLAFVDEARPDVLFDLNRSREQLPGLPRSVRHVCWVVDAGNRPLAQIAGSEITYFFGANWLRQYLRRQTATGLVDWLAPGVCPDTYHFAAVEPTCDLLFAGHIPRPWTDADLQRVLPLAEGNGAGPSPVRFEDVVRLVEQHWDAGPDGFRGFDNDQYLGWVLELVRRTMGVSAQVPNEGSLYYDISCRLIRGINRRRLLDRAVSAGVDLRIYGAENFRLYSSYARHYRQFVEEPTELAALYRGARLTLHEGVGPHFRTFECMAAGGTLFALVSPDDDDLGGMKTLFDPGVHYVPFTLADFQEQTARYLRDHEARRRIAEAAAGRVHERHNWTARTRQILDDLERG